MRHVPRAAAGAAGALPPPALLPAVARGGPAPHQGPLPPPGGARAPHRAGWVLGGEPFWGGGG